MDQDARLVRTSIPEVKRVAPLQAEPASTGSWWARWRYVSCLAKGALRQGCSMTRGTLIDLLAGHQPSDTAAEMGKQQTSYKQLPGPTRAIREQIMRSPVGPGPIVIADGPGAGACATIAAAQALGREYVPLSANQPVMGPVTGAATSRPQALEKGNGI